MDTNTDISKRVYEQESGIAVRCLDASGDGKVEVGVYKPTSELRVLAYAFLHPIRTIRDFRNLAKYNYKIRYLPYRKDRKD